MDLGMALPHLGKYASTDAIGQVAVEAEDMGLRSLWVLERLLRPLNPTPYPSRPGFQMREAHGTVFEAMDTLAYAAAKTSRIRLGTSVIDALYHVPAVVGRRLATLDQLSGGRVIAGLGQGYLLEEFQTANVPPSRRGSGFEEFVAALHALWGPDPVSFEGRFYRIPESNFNPKPVQPGGPKIIIGANAPAAIERAARIADGFNPDVRDLAVFDQAVGRYRDAARAAGKDPAAMMIVIRTNPRVTDRKAPDTPFLGGTIDKIADDVRQLEPYNVDEVFFDFNHFDMPVVDQLHAIETLQKVVA